MEYFFISKLGDEVAGYVQAIEDGPRTLRITMFRLAMQWHHTSVPASLLNNVHDFCCQGGYSTVVVDAGAVPPVVLRVLPRCGLPPRSAQGRWGRSMLECEVSATANPVRGDRMGSNRAADAIAPADSQRVAGQKSP